MAASMTYSRVLHWDSPSPMTMTTSSVKPGSWYTTLADAVAVTTGPTFKNGSGMKSKRRKSTRKVACGLIQIQVYRMWGLLILATHPDTKYGKWRNWQDKMG
jgi:hypothetical protein